MLTVEDVEAIRMLTHRYALYCDTGQIASLVATFCDEDPSFQSVANPAIVGVQNLHDYYTRVLSATAHQIHVSTNHIIEGDGKEADGSCYVICRSVTRDGGQIELFGVYYDRYVKTDSGWRFRSRRAKALIPYDVPALTRDWDRYFWGLAEDILRESSGTDPAGEEIRVRYVELMAANRHLTESYDVPHKAPLDEVIIPQGERS
jgi:SnoaL-like domain